MPTTHFLERLDPSVKFKPRKVAAMNHTCRINRHMEGCTDPFTVLRMPGAEFVDNNVKAHLVQELLMKMIIVR